MTFGLDYGATMVFEGLILRGDSKMSIISQPRSGASVFRVRPGLHESPELPKVLQPVRHNMIPPSNSTSQIPKL
jgi:hypothetical protein